MPASGVGPPTFRLQGERNNHYATQAHIYIITRHFILFICNNTIYQNINESQIKINKVNYFMKFI